MRLEQMRERYDNQDTPTFQSALLKLLEEEYKLLGSKKILELLSEDINKLHKEYYSEQDKNGLREIVFTTKGKDKQHKNYSKKSGKVTVILPLVTKDNIEKKVFNNIDEKNNEAKDLELMERLLKDAKNKGGLLSGNELSILMNRSLNTIKKYLDTYTEKNGGEILPLKGYILDQKNLSVENIKTEVIEIKEETYNKLDKITFIKTTPKIKAPSPSNSPLSNLTCLYIEDEIDAQALFKIQMKNMKEINFATSFEKALPLLKSKHFDLIVTDINLKGNYNGLDVMHAIKRMPGYENTPIIAATSYILSKDRERFIQAGFSDFIHKPILRIKLESSVKRLFDV